MADNSISVRLTGASVLRDGSFSRGPLSLRGGIVVDDSLPAVDLSGYMLLPGIIDLHGDAFERHIAPRPSAPFDIETGLTATDRDAAANGITTAWLAQSWSWEGGKRGPDFAEEVLVALDAYRARALTDLRIQIRCETHTVDTLERLLDNVKRHAIDYVIFNNHLDEAHALAKMDPETLAHWAKSAGKSPAEHLAAIESAKRQSAKVPRFLCSLSEAFDALGVRYGSHDDADGTVRETYAMIGARICEFPVSNSAAAVASAGGDPILMGAPNVVRGRSQAGNIAAIDLIRQGRCDALVSDYYYPALSKAAFYLADTGLRTLPEAWAMVSEIPAKVMGLTDRGRIEPGLRADFVIVDEATRSIEGTVSGGRITHLAGGAAQRFIAANPQLAIAAE
ncbi:MAG: alpha-D-ribose 1-methylphosphonate 5-triphosphate diphosphatase [Pseudomonadota bacterium]